MANVHLQENLMDKSGLRLSSDYSGHNFTETCLHQCKDYDHTIITIYYRSMVHSN